MLLFYVTLTYQSTNSSQLRRPGRPHIKWSDQIRDTLYNTPGDIWRCLFTVVEQFDDPHWLYDSDDNDDDIYKQCDQQSSYQANLLKL